jgi:hypothetical protein
MLSAVHSVSPRRSMNSNGCITKRESLAWLRSELDLTSLKVQLSSGSSIRLPTSKHQTRAQISAAGQLLFKASIRLILSQLCLDRSTDDHQKSSDLEAALPLRSLHDQEQKRLHIIAIANLNLIASAELSALRLPLSESGPPPSPWAGFLPAEPDPRGAWLVQTDKTRDPGCRQSRRRSYRRSANG